MTMEGYGFDRLAHHGRADYRMLTDEQSITDEQGQQLLAELADWRKDHPNPRDHGKPYPISRLAADIGVSSSVLSELLRGRYKGDAAKVLRDIDRFLAEDRQRAGRCDFRRHAKLGLTRKIFGVIGAGIRNNTMPVIIGPPGCGKTAHARAFAAERGAVVLIRPDQAHGDDRGVSALLCRAVSALSDWIHHPHRTRVAEILRWLATHRNAVLIVDEANKLDRRGLEMLRDFHDASDPSGQRCTPIVFFGDENFYKLLQRTKDGHRTPIAPQMIRRMIPVFDIARDGAIDDDGTLFTAEDIAKIIRNDRVRLLTAPAVRWVTDLANVHGYGLLGFAVAVLRQALDLVDDQAVDVTHLQESLQMTAGRTAAVEIDSAAGGTLLSRAG